MGYKESLEAAGAKVIDFQDFGDYQGTWLAAVKYKNKLLIIEGSYGSCSGCDSFQGAFQGIYEDKSTDEALKRFGESYLNDPIDIDVKIKELNKHSSWDNNEKMLEWLINAKNLYFAEKLEEIINEDN